MPGVHTIARHMTHLAFAAALGGAILSTTPASAAATRRPTITEPPAMMDPRVSTYAERQTIRDRYRGQIDELTFNDELGDGVSLDQALLDAMAAWRVAHGASRP